MTPDERPQKKDAFLSFLTEGWVSVHLDARRVEPAPDVGHKVFGQKGDINVTDTRVTTFGLARRPAADFHTIVADLLCCAEHAVKIQIRKYRTDEAELHENDL